MKSIVNFLFIFNFFQCFDFLYCRFGESINGGLVVVKLVWLNEWVILIGLFLLIFGVGFQSFIGIEFKYLKILKKKKVY